MAMEVILMTVWGVAAAGLAWYAASVAREVTYVTLAVKASGRLFHGDLMPITGR